MKDIWTVIFLDNDSTISSTVSFTTEEEALNYIGLEMDNQGEDAQDAIDTVCNCGYFPMSDGEIVFLKEAKLCEKASL